MIRKVRNKFIAIAMLTIIVCTTILVLAINVVNFIQTDREVNVLLQSIGDNGGKIPNNLFREKGNVELPINRNIPFPFEAQFENRFFTVIYLDNGNTLTDVSHIAAVNESEAVELADQAKATGKTLDYMGTYKFYCKETEKGDVFIVVMDVESRINAMKSLANTSLFMELICIIVMFGIIALCSKVAIRPFVESQKKQKQFITDASHELKTPLTVIATNMDILAMDLGKNEWVDGTRKQVSSLRKLVNHLVSLSRLEEDDNHLLMNQFDLSAAVREAAEPFAGMAEFEGIDFEEQIEEGIEIKGDENATRQLVAILCDNAVKYVTKNGTITVCVKRKGRKTYFSVTNTCAEEISPEILKRLFDRFYRADSARTREQGKNSFGIGLSIAKAITEKQGGKISATQDKDYRITFKCVF